jgi:addiction module HigA family antidote
MEQLPKFFAGEVLREEFLRPMGLSARKLARRMGVPANRITQIAAGQRRITAATAVRLERALGASAEFWMRLQVGCDLARAGHVRAVPVTGRGLR